MPVLEDGRDYGGRPHSRGQGWVLAIGMAGRAKRLGGYKAVGGRLETNGSGGCGTDPGHSLVETVTYAMGGGVRGPQKGDFVGKIGLRFRASLINFIFFRRKKFSDVGRGGGGAGQAEEPSPPPPPRGTVRTLCPTPVKHHPPPPPALWASRRGPPSARCVTQTISWPRRRG